MASSSASKPPRSNQKKSSNVTFIGSIGSSGNEDSTISSSGNNSLPEITEFGDCPTPIRTSPLKKKKALLT